jgi:hypothetical protein
MPVGDIRVLVKILTTDQKVRGSNPFVRTHVRHMKPQVKAPPPSQVEGLLRASFMLIMKIAGCGGTVGGPTRQVPRDSGFLTSSRTFQQRQSGPHGDAPARDGLPQPRRPGNVPEAADVAKGRPVPGCATAG